MEPSEHPQGRDPTASASPEQGPGNELVASPVATGCADIGELLPALLGAVGEGLLVLGATESPPIWHNPQALPALRLLEPPASSERWEQLVTRLREQLADATEASPLVRLPHNVESPTRGRLHFIDGGAVDWVLRRIAGQSDRWLLQLRDVTKQVATESALHRSDAALQNVVNEQQMLLQMIRQLGTPVLPIHSRIVVLPLVGHIDSGRAEHIMDAALSAIVRYQAAVVIIDITGVSVVDTAVANSLLQTVAAADLIGSLSILVGISAEVARSMVHLGVNLERMVTRRDLQAGIAYALHHTGHAIVQVREEIDWLSTFMTAK